MLQHSIRCLHCSSESYRLNPMVSTCTRGSDSWKQICGCLDMYMGFCYADISFLPPAETSDEKMQGLLRDQRLCDPLSYHRRLISVHRFIGHMPCLLLWTSCSFWTFMWNIEVLPLQSTPIWSWGHGTVRLVGFLIFYLLLLLVLVAQILVLSYWRF